MFFSSPLQPFLHLLTSFSMSVEILEENDGCSCGDEQPVLSIDCKLGILNDAFWFLDFLLQRREWSAIEKSE